MNNKQELLDWPDTDAWSDDAPFERLNGRQIRNVLFSAVSIAQTDSDKRLTIEHIKKIEKVTTEFENDTHNMLESARAAAEVGFDKG